MLLPTEASIPRVVRSAVPAGKGYAEYRPYLRYDFFYSCAYCMMTEAEACAIRFTIDHYEPRKARPELEHEYENLMYACDPCNGRKGDRCPPPEARAVGYRFFRPDEDSFADHFYLTGLRIESKTQVGEYSINALDLNRQTLRRLRGIRRRLADCDSLVAEGVLGLRRFHIDQLPPHIKGQALSAINRASGVAADIVKDIDEILRSNARSELVDDDPDSETRSAERAANLGKWGALYPGTWRAPRTSRER
jgi:hypothetical protein